MNGFSLYHLCSHATGGNRGSAAKGFKFHITDNLIFINIQIDSHNIAALGITYGTHAAGVINFPYISWMLKMIHNFFCIHNLFSPFQGNQSALFPAANRRRFELFRLMLDIILIKRGHTAQFFHDLLNGFHNIVHLFLCVVLI